MEESDDDDDDESSEEEAELDVDTFDTQRLVEDEADQKYLDSLPEFDREAILGERFEKAKAGQDMKNALRESK
jgi:RNA polymerase-associated protein RTF1